MNAFRSVNRPINRSHGHIFEEPALGGENAALTVLKGLLQLAQDVVFFVLVGAQARPEDRPIRQRQLLLRCLQ